MGITRRRFLGYTTGVVTAGLWRLPFDSTRRSCVLLDLKEDCGLSESIAGYESALTSAGAMFTRTDDQWSSPTRCAVLIVPAAQDIPPAAVRAILSYLHAGASVILESGAGFAGDREFRAHRAVLRDYLEIHIGTPVELWPPHHTSRRIPYVDYTWPRPAKVRDFSRVVPVEGKEAEIIARVDGLPVALKRPSGRGRLIFLGSPLGPALWAGDAAARRWLFDCLLAAGGERA